MLRVLDLEKSYGDQVLFSGVTFALGKGERCGLVGRNGEGKTTLFKLILGEERPDSGSISVPKGYRVGHLGQHLKFTLPNVVDEGVLGLPEAERDQRWRVEAILSGLGFAPEDLAKDPAELSGGFHIRLAMAKVLVSQPDLLLLDEPTNYLDIVSVRWLQRFLRSWRDELMIITHDRGFMDSVTTHTLGVHRRKVRKVAGGTQKLYDQLLAEEEVHENTRKNVEAARKHIQSFVDRFRAKASKATLVQSRLRMLEKLPELEQLTDLRDLDFSFTAAPFPGKTLMEVGGLTFGYLPQQPPLIEGVSLWLEPGDRVAVIGKNGRGKSTLLKLLGRELEPWGGEVKQHPATRVGYFGQTNIDRLTPAVSIEEEVASVNPGLTRTQIRGLCGTMMFDGDKAEKKISVLSGGEKSRVLLAKLLAQPSNVLLLDEPTSHLDVESVEALVEAIEGYRGAVVIVTHSEGILRQIATKLVVFQAGKEEVFVGTYDEFLERRGWVEEEAEGGEGPSRSAHETLVAEPARVALTPKERRAERAVIVAERARMLGPLKKKVEGLEAEIIALEEKIEAENAELVEASTSGDGARIAALAKSVGLAKARVEELFAALETASVEYEAKAKEFEERLAGLEG